MRSAAQVAPDALAGAGVEVVVGGELVTADLHDLGVTRFVVDEFQLVGLVGQLGAGLFGGFVDPPVEQLAFLDDLAHPLFQRRQVLGRERLGHVEVVVEAVGDGWSDAELGLRKQLLDGLGQHVRGRMADHAATVVGVGGHRRDIGVDVGHPAQVAQVAVGVAHDDDRIGRTAPR
ncbi:Uncharacterised protein [Mycobacterium tuberculosis]|nr:Uncharacterised protein [Mycobacterium tuberculosis]